LEPGKSSHDESLNTARRLTFIGKEEKMKPDDSWSHFYCKNPSKEPCMSMRFDKEVLAEVGLYPNYSMTLEQAVKYLGEPDFFTTIFLGELNPRCDFSFLWLKQRIELNTGDELYGSSLCFKDYRKEDKVPNDLIVNTVYINSTERMEEIIKSINLPMSGYMIWNWAGFSEQK
jgi:hypothetical protein